MAPTKSRSGSRRKPTRLTNRDILIAILKEMFHMAQHFDRLTESVRRNTDVTASAAAMIHGLAEQIRNATDPAAIAALADELDVSADALAAAVAANTPAEPPATPEDPAPVEPDPNVEV